MFSLEVQLLNLFFLWSYVEIFKMTYEGSYELVMKILKFVLNL